MLEIDDVCLCISSTQHHFYQQVCIQELAACLSLAGVQKVALLNC